jgi:hypothetical protein
VPADQSLQVKRKAWLLKMNSQKFANWLKVIVFGTGICGIFLYLFLFPEWGRSISVSNPEYSFAYWPWMIFLWISAVPCYLTLICCYRIASEIGKENSFCNKNAKQLRLISLLAAADTVYFFMGNLVFFFLNMSHPGIILLALIVVFIGIAITVAAAALSHLVYKAAKLQEENEYTI